MNTFKFLALLVATAGCMNCGCLSADAQQGSANPEPPAAAAHDQAISKWVQKAQQDLTQNDLRGAHLAAQEALHLAGIQSDAFADELAPVYLRSEQYQQAAALFGPYPGRNRNLSLNEAIALVKIGRLTDARKCWRESQLLTYHQNFKPYLLPLSTARTFEVNVFLCRGITDVDQNNPQDGVWALRHALPLAPNNPLLLLYYAEALARVGQSQKARHFYQQAIKRDHSLVFQKAQMGLMRLDHAANS
jgi:tetratricopeptide (TPR) repeat protein